VIRSVARLVNPLVLRIAARRHMPVVGIVHHRGRKTGRPYATPLGIRPSAAPAMGAVEASLLWPGIALAILTVIGLFGGLGLRYLAGHKR
jgi:hypothetical protein